MARFLEQKQKVPGLFQTSPRTGAASLLLHSVGESKSKGQSKFRCRGIDFTALWVEKSAHTGREEIDSDHLWRRPHTHTQLAITGLLMHQLDLIICKRVHSLYAILATPKCCQSVSMSKRTLPFYVYTIQICLIICSLKLT